MTTEHDDTAWLLHHQLAGQVHPRDYRVGSNSGRLRWRDGSQVSIPDLVVIPTPLVLRNRGTPRMLNVYDDPLPLVVEVWSPSTGRYDVETKLAAYQARGDGEIWLLHPYERTLTAWRRQPDGGYTRHDYTGGIVEPATLPGVRIDLESLFP